MKNSEIYVSITGVILQQKKNLFCAEKYPTFYAISYWFQQIFNWHLQIINIANNYVSWFCIHKMSIELSKGGRNNQHSMLDFHKEETASLENKSHGLLLVFM